VLLEQPTIVTSSFYDEPSNLQVKAYLLFLKDRFLKGSRKTLSLFSPQKQKIMSGKFAPRLGSIVVFKHLPKRKLIVTHYIDSQGNPKGGPDVSFLAVICDYEDPLNGSQMIVHTSLLKSFEAEPTSIIVADVD